MEINLVSASTGVMGSLLGKLGAMLSDEYKLLKGVRKDIEFLKSELEAMHAFLLVMSDMEEPDPQDKLRADAVRELSYEIEDKIDKFILLVDHESSSNSDGFGEFFSKSMKKIKNIKRRHKIANDVKDIKSHIKDVSDRYVRFKIDESSIPRHKRVDPRLCALYKDASELVGIDGPRDELLKWLSYEAELAQHPKVMSIVGYGGLGKTTLARQVYDKLGANFECRAFVSISRSPDMMKILSSILSQLRNEDYVVPEAGDPQHIIDQIRNFLRDKRYFIIIDDVWDIQTWRTLDCALIKNRCGSVIMTTTRVYDVAHSCCSSDGDLVYKIQPLSVPDSKKLFFKRIFDCEENCPPNLKAASEDILRKCAGMPLAINAISGLLATGKTREEWEHIRYSIGFAKGRNLDIDAMNFIMCLSYLDLPLYLRSCLLYLTMYPEDYVIERQRLVYRWISEGFIQSECGEDLVELGEKYFHELVNRSLIQPVNISYDDKALCCRVHDTVLDFLIYKSGEENFSTLSSNHSKPDRRIRRLSLIGNENQGSVEQLDLSHARSLGVFKNCEKLPSLMKSSALRVLDLQDCRKFGNEHVKDIARLFQLRYLNLHFTGITELPRQIGDLAFLETLNVTTTSLVELPDSVTRLKRLARLFVPAMTKIPDGIGLLQNLQELLIIEPMEQSLNFLEELGKLTNLMQLSIFVDVNEFDQAPCKREKLVSSLRKLDTCKLKSLSVIFYLAEKDANLIAGSPFYFPALKSIRDVTLRGRVNLRKIIEWLRLLVQLEELTLDVYEKEEIEQQDIFHMVGSIPTLLGISGWGHWVGPIVMSSNSGGFQQLQHFVSYGSCSGFKFEAGAMPNLKKLDVHLKPADCGGGFDGLGIQHLSSLASFQVTIECGGERATDVEAAEVALKSMANAHPNRPTLEMSRFLPSEMLQDHE